MRVLLVSVSDQLPDAKGSIDCAAIPESVPTALFVQQSLTVRNFYSMPGESRVVRQIQTCGIESRPAQPCFMASSRLRHV